MPIRNRVTLYQDILIVNMFTGFKMSLRKINGKNNSFEDIVGSI